MTSFLDGRALRVMTVVVQTLVVAALTGLILGTQWAPVVGAAALQGDAAVLGRMAAWPPAWFVGLYQVILAEGPGQEVFSALMRPALVTTLVALGVCAPATLLLWRRSLEVLVSAAPGEAPGQAWSLARSLPRWLARPPLDRAFIQFFVAVIWRSPRHRLAALAAAGLAFAIGLEGMLTLTVRVPTNSRWLTEFAVPLLALLCLLSVFRWLLTLPAELPASWVMGLVTPASGATVRRAVGRLFLALVVAPPTLMAFALSSWQGGLTSALAHGALTLLIGLGLVEHALTRVTFMPFATEYLPGRSNLKARWPIHVAVLVFVVPAVAQLERALVVAPGVALRRGGDAGHRGHRPCDVSTRTRDRRAVGRSRPRRGVEAGAAAYRVGLGSRLRQGFGGQARLTRCHGHAAALKQRNPHDPRRSGGSATRKA